MSYNEKLPEWYAPGTEPPESKKTAGWDPGDKPPAGYFNWLFNKAYLALKELQSKAAEKTIFDGHASDLTKHPLYGVTAGTVNAYTVTFNPAPTAYTDGMAIALKIHANASAGSATINVNGLGAKSLKKANGLDATNLKKDGIYTFRYNTTTGNFILQGEGGAGNANPSDVLVGKTFSNDSGDQTGTMPDRSAVIITPSTANQTIANGYHNGAGYVKGDANLIPANILLGKSIFGVSGSVRQYPTKLRNVKVGNPIWTKTYSWTGPGNVESRIYIPDKFDAYIYMTSDSANKVLEKRAQSNGVIAWSSTLPEFIQDAVLDSQDNLWVLTGSRVRKYTSSGSFTDFTVSGGGKTIHVDGNDNIYVADALGGSKAFSLTNAGAKRWEYPYSSTTSSIGSALAPDAFYVSVGTPTGPVVYKLNLNGGLISSSTTAKLIDKGVVTKDGTIYSGGGGAFYKTDKNLISFAMAPGFRYATSLVKDENDNIYVADDNASNGILIALNDDLSRRTTLSVLNASSSPRALGITKNGRLIFNARSEIQIYDLEWLIFV